MRKGTKTIRKVSTSGGEYYVYDLDPDIHGKRRRLYGKTLKELDRKIKRAQKEKEAILKRQTPVSSSLSAFAEYYFKCIETEKMPTVLQREYKWYESTIKGSEIDVEVTDTNFQDTLTAYYQKIMANFNSQAQAEIFGILKGIENTAKKLKAIPKDADWKVPEPRSTTEWDFKHILSEDELNTLINYCVEDKCKKFSINEAFILLVSLTGISLADAMRLKAKDVKFTEHGADITTRGTTKRRETIIKADERFKQIVKSLSRSGIFNLKSPDELFVVTGDKKIFYTSVTNTLKRIGDYCGFPDGVTMSNLHKAVVMQKVQ